MNEMLNVIDGLEKSSSLKKFELSSVVVDVVIVVIKHEFVKKVDKKYFSFYCKHVIYSFKYFSTYTE